MNQKTVENESLDDLNTRFSGVARLIGVEGLKRLSQAHVCVIGVGGVGSWAVEALARSGVGALTLVDLDDVCVSNVNRQLHAIDGRFGLPKVQVMAERVRQIHPACRVSEVRAFFTATTAETLLSSPLDYVFDAIDRPLHKCLLAAACAARGLPLLIAGAAGGRRDPTAIRIADLAGATHDRLLAEVRRQLRADHNFPRAPHLMNVDCVFSVERPVSPRPDGSVGEKRGRGADLRLDCESGYGTASFVTGAFGFAAVSHMVRRLTSDRTI